MFDLYELRKEIELASKKIRLVKIWPISTTCLNETGGKSESGSRCGSKGLKSEL